MTTSLEEKPLLVENERLRQRVTELEQHVQRQDAQIHRYEQILNRLPAMVIIKDTHSRLTYGNQTFRDLYGMSQTELQGLIDAAFNDPTYTAQYVEDDTYVLQTGQIREVEEPVTRHDGVVRMVHTIKAPLYNQDGQIDALVAVCTDITERKQAQVALEALNADLSHQVAQQTAALHVFQALVDNVPDAVAITDADAVLTYVNPAFKQLYGYGDASVGMSIPAFFPQTEQARLTEVLVHIQEHDLWQGVLTHQCQDGRLFPGETAALVIRDSQGQVQAMGVIVRDITIRQQQEEALRRNEMRLQTLLKATPDMILRVSQDHIFVDYREAQDIPLYVPPEVFLGKRVADILPSDVAQLVVQTATQVLHTGERQQIEYRLTMSDGHHWFHAWVVASEENTYTLLIRDITQYKQQQHMLLDLNERLSFILEGSQDGAWDVNLATGEFYYSPRFAEMLGYHVDELAPTVDTWMSKVHPDDIDKVNQLVQDYLAGRISLYEGEYRMHHKSGDWIWILARGKVTLRDDQGQPLRMAGTLSDITRRKQQEETLRWFSHAIQSTGDLIGITDINGQSLYHNQAFLDRLGYTPAELNALGGPSAIYTDPQQAAAVFAALHQGCSWKGEITLRSRDGSYIPILLRADVIRNDAGQPVGFIGVQTDITAQKQAEAERIALQQQVIDAQRNVLRELSAPLIPISNEVMIMPLIGTVDSGRAYQVMETLLEGVAAYQAQLVIIDITGVAVVDTQVAQALISAAKAVKLLGAQVMLTGIQPQIAQTLVHLGVDLSGLITCGTLQTGIAIALKRNVDA